MPNCACCFIHYIQSIVICDCALVMYILTVMNQSRWHSYRLRSGEEHQQNSKVQSINDMHISFSLLNIADKSFAVALHNGARSSDGHTSPRRIAVNTIEGRHHQTVGHREMWLPIRANNQLQSHGILSLSMHTRTQHTAEPERRQRHSHLQFRRSNRTKYIERKCHSTRCHAIGLSDVCKIGEIQRAIIRVGRL